MGYQAVDEARLQDLRNKHRPSVLSSMENRAKGLRAWRSTSGLASKLYNFKRDAEPLVSISIEQLNDSKDGDVNQETGSGNIDDMYHGLTVNTEIDLLPDPKDQVSLPICLIVSLASNLQYYIFQISRTNSCISILVSMVFQSIYSFTHAHKVIKL
jgi:hypothetical protein